MWCTLRSRIFRNLWLNISTKLKPNSKILKPVYQGPRWVRIMKKMEVKNLVTHSHCGVKLRGVHPTLESSFAVCITPRSQTANCGVKIKIFASLWLVLQGQTGEIPLGVNTYYMKERFEEHFYDLLRLKFWLRGVHHIFWSLWSNISAKSKLNWKIL